MDDCIHETAVVHPMATLLSTLFAGAKAGRAHNDEVAPRIKHVRGGGCGDHMWWTFADPNVTWLGFGILALLFRARFGPVRR